eukprot:5412497-Prorocentrum_lima.AAC.1
MRLMDGEMGFGAPEAFWCDGWTLAIMQAGNKDTATPMYAKLEDVMLYGQVSGYDTKWRDVAFKFFAEGEKGGKLKNKLWWMPLDYAMKVVKLTDGKSWKDVEVWAPAKEIDKKRRNSKTEQQIAEAKLRKRPSKV